jgi:hypothetical protein
MFARDHPWLIGPLLASDAAKLALAFRTWRTEHPLDREASRVAVQDLLDEPSRWHMRRIDVTGEWHFRFEGSAFANVWLRPPNDLRLPYGTYRARMIGTWIYPVAEANRGYGHGGMWPGELRTDSIEIIAGCLDEPR